MTTNHRQERINCQDMTHSEIDFRTHAHKHDGDRKDHGEMLLPGTCPEAAHNRDDATPGKNQKTDGSFDTEGDWKEVPPTGAAIFAKQVRVVPLCIVRAHGVDSRHDLTERNRKFDYLVSKAPEEEFIRKRTVNIRARGSDGRHRRAREAIPRPQEHERNTGHDQSSHEHTSPVDFPK